jgi:hypothetical protein
LPRTAGSQVGKSGRDEADPGSNGASLSGEAEGLTGVVEIGGSSLGPSFASGGGLDNAGAGEVVDWRLDTKLGLGVRGGGGPPLPAVDPLRDGATRAGALKAFGLCQILKEDMK